MRNSALSASKRKAKGRGNVKSFHWRCFVAFSAGVSLLAVAFTGFGLYVAPHGRYIYGGSWMLWGKYKLLHAHVMLALLLLIFSLWHVYFNRHTILHYLRERNRESGLMKPELLIALLLVTYIFFYG